MANGKNSTEKKVLTNEEPEKSLEKSAPVKPVKPPKKEAPKKGVKERELTPVPLNTFAALSGIKWDQIAGFAHYAKLNQLKPRTVPEWREALRDFGNRPV